ncbi:MAG TPA: hypothetical protein VF463_02155 [Sphingobium sp.]
MSLISYLNFGTGNSTGTSTGSLGSAYTTALQQLTATQARMASASASSTTSGSGVIISANATIAAATKADAKKDAATLATDIRTALDAQYKANGKGKMDLSAMSPRAVATIALNSDGSFSKAEVLTAKAEMRTRDRAAFFQVTANDFSVSSLEAYQSARMVGYGAMSVEERTLRASKG